MRALSSKFIFLTVLDINSWVATAAQLGSCVMACRTLPQALCSSSSRRDGRPAQAVRCAPDARAEAVAQGALPYHHAHAAKLQLLHLRAHDQSMLTRF